MGVHAETQLPLQSLSFRSGYKVSADWLISDSLLTSHSGRLTREGVVGGALKKRGVVGGANLAI